MPLDHTSAETVPVSFVYQLTAGAQARGRSLGTVQAEIDEIHAQSLGRITLNRYINLFWKLQCQLQDELMGLFPDKVPLGFIPPKVALTNTPEVREEELHRSPIQRSRSWKNCRTHEQWCSHWYLPAR